MKEKINSDFFLLNKGYSNYEDSTELPRHRWYYYKEGFSPNFVEQAIKYSGISKNDIVLDPFNGSGTTTLTASMAGFKAVGVEVNPFTSFLASVKLENINCSELNSAVSKLLVSCKRGADSNLIGFSTFTDRDGLDKWLFNRSIIRAFEGGWRYASRQNDESVQRLLKLALITTAMQNCNAVKDGKCLRYRQTWKSYNYDVESFIETLAEKINCIKADILFSKIEVQSEIINSDVRGIFEGKELPEFKLCITSPPYLNTFDYTDIYRPELFLGKFIKDNEQLYNLRLQTVRSHIQAKWAKPTTSDFGPLYTQSVKYIVEHKELLMDQKIPLMIQAYFEDMHSILRGLKNKALPNAQLWLVVSNSAYAGYEIPVDLIIGDIGSRVGWSLKEIGVMRHVKKRKTKYSPNVLELRESVIIFENFQKA